MVGAVADRGYYGGGEIKACANSGVTAASSKRLTSNAVAERRLDGQESVCDAAKDLCRRLAAPFAG
jgi:hypothetical protein